MVDNDRRVPRIYWLVCPILLLLGLYGAVHVYLLLARPMFFNDYGRSDHMLFAMWMGRPPRLDQAGNAAIADHRLNLLVIFLLEYDTGDGGRMRFSRHYKKGGVTFHAENGMAFSVPRLRDTMIVFGPDGSRRDHCLMPGEAERICELLPTDAGDMRESLVHLYAEKHPGRVTID